MEAEISSLIVRKFLEEMLENLRVEVAVVGAGPAGLTAARYLAREGVKVVVFERNLWVGGGMWGGGMLFPKMVVEEEACHLLREIGVRVEGEGELLTADTVEVATKCASSAIDAGARILVGMEAEDLIVKDGRVCGVVVNSSAARLARLHVDPLGVEARMVVDATGHEASLVRALVGKGKRINTPSGGIEGEGPMDAERAEREVVRYTGEVYPGLVVTGMSVSAVFGLPRMGPVFGGMFLSGKRAAEIVVERLKQSSW